MAEATDVLFNQLPTSKKVLFDAARGLDRASRFMHDIRDPQEQFKSIHIAGTSGKGSVALYLTSLLVAHGKKIGTHVSPHVDDMRERAMLNGKIPSEKQWLAALNKIIPIINRQKTLDERPTYFVAANAIANTLFEQQNVDYAVIETGIGGIYDSSNVMRRSDKLAVITKLGLDHTELLGSTLPEIAYQKSGIFPFDGEALYLKPDRAEVESVLIETARVRTTKLVAIEGRVKNVVVTGVKLFFDYVGTQLVIDKIELPTAARYQAENAGIALASFERLAERDGWKIDESLVRNCLANTVAPGRMEILTSASGIKVVFDGAHNPQKIAGLLESLSTLPSRQKPVWVVATKKGKDITAMLRLLVGHVDAIVATQYSGSGSEHFAQTALPADELAAAAKDVGLSVLATEVDAAKALKIALDKAKLLQLVVVSGSMYVLTEAKRQLA